MLLHGVESSLVFCNCQLAPQKFLPLSVLNVPKMGIKMSVCVHAQSHLTLCDPHGLERTRLLCP